MPHLNEIEIRSEQVQEVLNRTPSWMTRWGLSAMLGVIMLLIFLSWLIRYPDMTQGQIVITTKSPPIKIVSQASGKLVKLYKYEGTFLEKGEVFAEIENTVSQEGIGFLNEVLNQSKQLMDNSGIKLNFKDDNL